MKKQRINKKILLRYLPVYLLILPSLVYIFINNYIPMAGIIVAFKKYSAKKGIFGSDWIGLKNFEYLLKADAATIIRNTLGYNVVFIILNMVVGVTLAILITDVVSKVGKKIYQSAILLPFLLSMVIVSYIVFAFLSAETGMINKSILEPMGRQGVVWYQVKGPWPYILTFVNLWKGVGYGTLIYIAGIAGIDKSFFEAAELDGATRWQRIRFITLPCLKSSLITMFLLSVGRIFYSDFGLFYQVPQNSGALYDVTDTIDTYVYRALMSAGGIGKSSAAGVLQSVVGFVLVILSNSVVNRLSKENALF